MLIRFPGGGDWIRVDGDDPDRPGMHATDTLDFMVVLDGRIVLGLDDGEHELGAGRRRRAARQPAPVAGGGRRTLHVRRVHGPAGSRGGAAIPPWRWRRRAPPATAVPGGSWPPPATTARRTRRPTAIPPCALSPGADDGVALVELWQSGGPLASPEQGGDPDGGWVLEPRGGGVAFRWVRLPAGHDPGAAGWHTTATIDVDIVVSGRLELALPGTEPVVIGPGEAVVQRGTHHKWQPVGDAAVEFVSLMLAVG